MGRPHAARAVGLSDIRFPAFRPRPPWIGGDLQTLRNVIRRPVYDLAAFPHRRLELSMADGSGDVLLADVNMPSAGTGRALVMLVHGLTGCAESTYILATAQHLLGLGYPVMRLNLRGAGPSQRLCREHYHAGRSADLRQALATLPAALKDRGVLAVGYSLGANMLLKYLGEEGSAAPLLAAVSISAPIDLAATSRRMAAPRNRGYHDWLLARMRDEILSGPGLSATERDAIRRVQRIYDYDDVFVAPRNGFAGAADYYARCSARQFLSAIKVPTLLVHALDDPWIPSDAYRSYPWKDAPQLVPLLPGGGGHVGFHAVGSRVPWHDRCIGLFFEALTR